MFVNEEVLMDLGRVLLYLGLDLREPIILIRHLPIIIVDLLHLPEGGAQNADAVLNSIAPSS